MCRFFLLYDYYNFKINKYVSVNDDRKKKWTLKTVTSETEELLC